MSFCISNKNSSNFHVVAGITTSGSGGGRNGIAQERFGSDLVLSLVLSLYLVLSLFLWTDYCARFQTYTEANWVPNERRGHVFLVNQTSVTYKRLANLASQTSPPKNVNQLNRQEISDFMMDQFHPKRFIVLEHFTCWSKMDVKPGESIQELVDADKRLSSGVPFPGCIPVQRCVLVPETVSEVYDIWLDE